MKPTKWPVCPVKTQISLGICPVWSETLLSALRSIGSTQNAQSENSDQTGCTGCFVGFVVLLLDHELCKYTVNLVTFTYNLSRSVNLVAFTYNLSRSMTKPLKWCASNEVSDQPGHPPGLVRVFVVCLKKPWALSYPLSTQQRLWSDWADVQAVLSLRWAHLSFCLFCRAAAHLFLQLCIQFIFPHFGR